MINVATITGTNGLYKRLGWREPTKADYKDILDADNKASGSGLYFQDYNPLITVENVKQSQPDPDISNTDFNTYLDDIQKSIILKICNAIFKNQDDLLEESILFDRANIITKTISNESYFVGYEFTLARSADIVAKINALIGEFDGVATFNIYLYHSSQQTALFTQQIITVANSAKLLIPTTEWKIFYDTDSYKGGKFYIGYYQDDLGSVKALNRNWQDAALMNKMNHLGILPIKVTPNGTSLFNLDAVKYMDKTYGLNFDISIYQDFTQKILDNKQLFDDAIGYGMAVEVLKLILSSQRSNRAERTSKEAIAAFAELYGMPPEEGLPSTVGVEKRYKDEIVQVTKSIFNKERIKTGTLK